MGAAVWGKRRFVLALAVGAATLGAAAAAVAGGGLGDWPYGGQNLNNTRAQDQKVISVANAGRLAVKWTATVGGDVSSTPALDNKAVYVTDWGEWIPGTFGSATFGGSLTKLDQKTGATIWTRKIGSYAGEDATAVSRTSPAIADGVVYVGDQNGAHVLAVDAATGNLVWSTQINSGPFGIITQSPIVHAGVVYVGTASAEENVAANGGYPCCIYRGSVSALDAKTGRILWTTYMVPDNGGVPGGYSGGGVWSSTPVLDPSTRTLYVTTGNNYSVPDSVAQCQDGGGTPAQCLDPADHVDSFVALDAKTGAIKWATGVEGFDAWNVSCIPGFGDGVNCPTPVGPDYDFGSGPNLFSMQVKGKPRTVIGAGQKSGAYWLLDATTGEILWGTQVGPGSTLGGIEWGTSYADGRIYVALNNLDQEPYPPDGPNINYGSWAALDAQTGKVLWYRPDPMHWPLVLGPTTTSNGIVFAGSMSGKMYALDGATGAVLWSHTGQGASNAGPAISKDGVLYWGNGYARFGFGASSTTFYAFSIDGK